MTTTTEQPTTLQEQNTTNEQPTTTTNRRRVKVEHGEQSAPLGMVNIFRRGIKDGDTTTTAATFFQNRAALDGYGVRRLGGQAPSAYTSERGAAGAINAAFLDAVHNGVTVSDLLNITRAACLGRNGATGEPFDKLTAHIKSYFLQADPKRAAANGLVRAVTANGWKWADIAPRAVLLDGIAWNGEKFKRSVTLDTVVLPVVLIALHYKRTPSLAKALGIE
jgi:hypothetical protein